VIMTLHPRARAQAGSGLGLKRPERRRRRSRLGFCHRINEEDDALGMLQTTLLPPSKPGRPRGLPYWWRVRGKSIATGAGVHVVLSRTQADSGFRSRCSRERPRNDEVEDAWVTGCVRDAAANGIPTDEECCRSGSPIHRMTGKRPRIDVG
jgi:hypothetical protein